MSGAIAAIAQAHPLEVIGASLVLILGISALFGVAPAVSFFWVLFVGFAAALMFIGGAFFLHAGKVAVGVALLITGFVLVGAIGAGWVSFA